MRKLISIWFWLIHLILFLSSYAASGVCNVDVKFFGSLLDLASKSTAALVGDNSTVGCILVDKNVKIFNCANNNWLETGWKHILCFSVGAITNGWVLWCTGFLPAESWVNTTGKTPGWLNTFVERRLDAVELCRLLVDNWFVLCGCCWHEMDLERKGTTKSSLFVPNQNIVVWTSTVVYGTCLVIFRII